eukprot:6251181-Prymnesium_polylepis.1
MSTRRSPCASRAPSTRTLLRPGSCCAPRPTSTPRSPPSTGPSGHSPTVLINTSTHSQIHTLTAAITV